MFTSAGTYGPAGTLPMESGCGQRVRNRPSHTGAPAPAGTPPDGVENRARCGKPAPHPRSVSNTSRTFSTRRRNAGASSIISTARSRLWITVE
jgi:hypothetical protein